MAGQKETAKRAPSSATPKNAELSELNIAVIRRNEKPPGKSSTPGTKQVPSTSHKSHNVTAQTTEKKLPNFPKSFCEFKNIFHSKTPTSQKVTSLKLDKIEAETVYRFISELEHFERVLGSYSCDTIDAGNTLRPLPGHALNNDHTNEVIEQQQRKIEYYKAQINEYERKIHELTNK